MALHKNFPESPHAILEPDIRFVMTDDTGNCDDVAVYLTNQNI